MVTRAPDLAARYAAPPTPAAGVVAAANNAVAATSATRGAMASPRSCPNPIFLPNISATARRSELSCANWISLSPAQLLPSIAPTANAGWKMNPDNTDMPRPLARSVKLL